MRTASHYNPFERFRLRGAGATRSARRQRDACLESAEQCCCSECGSSHLGSSAASYYAARYGLPRYTGHDQSYQNCGTTATRAAGALSAGTTAVCAALAKDSSIFNSSNTRWNEALRLCRHKDR